MLERGGLRAFFVVAGVLFLLRVVYGFVVFPIKLVIPLSVLNAAMFVGLPIYALFRAGSHKWVARDGVVFLCGGVVLHIGGAFLARYVAGAGTPAEVFFMAIVQTGILCWTLGIGALLSLVIRDKNLLIPIAIFLVGFDMFLVFNPDSPTRRMLDHAPAVTQNVLATVPQPKAEGSDKAGVLDLARVGPADLLFAATFFAVLFKFNMRAKQTLAWMVPVLVLYLLVVIGFAGVSVGPLSLAMLPAMVPIGLTVLLVNRREFKMEKQEVAGIVFVALFAIALAWFGIYRAQQAALNPPEQQAGPLPSDGDRPTPGLEGSPSPTP